MEDLRAIFEQECRDGMRQIRSKAFAGMFSTNSTQKIDFEEEGRRFSQEKHAEFLKRYPEVSSDELILWGTSLLLEETLAVLDSFGTIDANRVKDREDFIISFVEDIGKANQFSVAECDKLIAAYAAEHPEIDKGEISMWAVIAMIKFGEKIAQENCEKAGN